MLRWVLQDLEEALADRATLLEQFEQLEASFKELLLQADEMHAKTEGLLTENLDTRVELAGKLTAAQVGAWRGGTRRPLVSWLCRALVTQRACFALNTLLGGNSELGCMYCACQRTATTAWSVQSAATMC